MYVAFIVIYSMNMFAWVFCWRPPQSTQRIENNDDDDKRLGRRRRRHVLNKKTHSISPAVDGFALQ